MAESAATDSQLAQLKRMSLPFIIKEYSGGKGVKHRCSILEESSHRRDPMLPTTDFAVITVEDDGRDNDFLPMQRFVCLLQVSSHSGNREIVKLKVPLLMQGCGHYFVSPRLFAVDEPRKRLFVLESRVGRPVESNAPPSSLNDLCLFFWLRRFQLSFDQCGMISKVCELDERKIICGIGFKKQTTETQTDDSLLPIRPVRLLISPRFGDLRVIVNRCNGYHEPATTNVKRIISASPCSLQMTKLAADVAVGDVAPVWHLDLLYPMLRNRMLYSSDPVLYVTGNRVPKFDRTKTCETVVVCGESLYQKYPLLRLCTRDSADMAGDEFKIQLKLIQMLENGQMCQIETMCWDVSAVPLKIIGVYKGVFVGYRKQQDYQLAIPQGMRFGRDNSNLEVDDLMQQDLPLLADIPWHRELDANQHLQLHMKSVWLVTVEAERWQVLKAPLKAFATIYQRCEGCLLYPNPLLPTAQQQCVAFRVCRTCAKERASSHRRLAVAFCSRRCLKEHWSTHRSCHHRTDDVLTQALADVRVRLMALAANRTEVD